MRPFTVFSFRALDQSLLRDFPAPPTIDWVMLPELTNYVSFFLALHSPVLGAEVSAVVDGPSSHAANLIDASRLKSFRTLPAFFLPLRLLKRLIGTRHL